VDEQDDVLSECGECRGFCTGRHYMPGLTPLTRLDDYGVNEHGE